MEAAISVILFAAIIYAGYKYLWLPRKGGKSAGKRDYPKDYPGDQENN